MTSVIRDRPDLARALNAVESSLPADVVATAARVDLLAGQVRPGGQVVGLTGPPGVGKSTLAGCLIAAWRAQGHTVGVIAVDPTSLRSGGALLGDRARMALGGQDAGVFVRSMAARDRLGGLAPATFSALTILRAACDRVLVETVGVGQSETDVARVADHTIVIVQPASGDTLQFLKAGLMEVPDVLVINKVDLGRVARQAASDLRRALAVVGSDETPVVATSAANGTGVAELITVLETLRQRDDEHRGRRQLQQLHQHVVTTFRDLYGRLALDRAGGATGAMALLAKAPVQTPSALLAALLELS